MTIDPGPWVVLLDPATTDAHVAALAQDEGWQPDGARAWHLDEGTRVRTVDDPRTGLRFLEVDGPLDGQHRVISATSTFLRVHAQSTVLHEADLARGREQQIAAVWALATVFPTYDPRAMAAIERLYAMPDEAVETAVVEALGWRCWPEAEPFLERVSAETLSPPVQALAAACAMRCLLGQGPYAALLPPQATDDAVDAAIRAAGGSAARDHAWQVDAATVRVADVPTGRVVTIDGPATDQDRAVRWLGEVVGLVDWLLVLEQAGAARDDAARADAAWALVTVFPQFHPRPLAALDRLYEAGGPTARRAVIASLAWRRWPEAGALLQRIATTEPDSAVRALAADATT